MIANIENHVSERKKDPRPLPIARPITNEGKTGNPNEADRRPMNSLSGLAWKDKQMLANQDDLPGGESKNVDQICFRISFTDQEDLDRISKALHNEQLTRENRHTRAREVFRVGLKALGRGML